MGKVPATPWRVMPSNTFHHIVGADGNTVMEVAAGTRQEERQLAELVCGMANNLPELIEAAEEHTRLIEGMAPLDKRTEALQRLQAATEAARRAV